ncbi:DUF4219 domain-containing protein [Tanacetum coccineum]
MQAASTYIREMYAIESVKRWRHYLLGKRFRIFTDQNSLKFILNQNIQTPEQQKWLSKLLGYEYDIFYKPGKENTVADALSRIDSSHTPTFCAFTTPTLPWLRQLRKYFTDHQEGQEFVKKVKTGVLDRSMDYDKYLEGQSMQRPPLFESDSFIYWKNRFETYVKSKDLDLCHVITNGDFLPIVQNPITKLDEVIPFEKQTDDLKKRLAKNNEPKMVIYNVLPRKEYERIFKCNTAKEIWKTLLITHQGNSQVKDNKIDLLVQQYEQFVISEDEPIDSAFARFNTIITSFKALDEGYSSKNYVRKFLRALHPK